MLGVLSLAENLLSVELGIDNLIVRRRFGARRVQGLPARAHVAGRSAQLRVPRGRPAQRALAQRDCAPASAQWLTVPALLIATLGLFGYICGVDLALSGAIPTPPWRPTRSIAFLSSYLGILGADPRFGVAAIVLSDTAGGFVARRLACRACLRRFSSLARAGSGRSVGRPLRSEILHRNRRNDLQHGRFDGRRLLDRVHIAPHRPRSSVRGTLALNVANAELVARGERLAIVQWELAHKARLSAMGEMAAALAHELNQPLTADGHFRRRDRAASEGHH